MSISTRAQKVICLDFDNTHKLSSAFPVVPKPPRSPMLDIKNLWSLFSKERKCKKFTPAFNSDELTNQEKEFTLCMLKMLMVILGNIRSIIVALFMVCFIRFTIPINSKPHSLHFALHPVADFDGSFSKMYQMGSDFLPDMMLIHASQKLQNPLFISYYQLLVGKSPMW